MILIEARDELMDLALAKSQLEFSERWMGKAPSYVSCLLARNLQPSTQALMTLANKIVHEVAQMRRTCRHAEAARLDELNGKVWKAIYDRCAG